MRRVVESRNFISFVLSAAIGLYLFREWSFPAGNNVIQMLLLQKPYLFYGAKYAFTAMLFTTPYIALSVLFSCAYIFVVRHEEEIGLVQLATYPEPALRKELFLTVGEIHHPRRAEPAANPHWLIIPERGLFTGIAIFGAIGSGKTSGCVYPFAEQLLAYRAQDSECRVAGLALEVKGDFCHKLHGILKKHGRDEDYVEVSLDSAYRYNPLHNDLEAYALAYGIASLLNNLFGRGKEPFWQQAYTNLVKFIILLHKVLYQYVTLFDVYECAINPQKLETRIAEGEQLFGTADYMLIDDAVYVAHGELARFPWERVAGTNRMKAPANEDLKRVLNAKRATYDIQTESGPSSDRGLQKDDDRRQRFEAVKRWFNDDWRRIEPKLRTSIVEGISVFLSLFDDNPAVKRTFCPPKECYDPIANCDGRYGTPLPPFSSLIEEGKVCALNFPVAANPGLARAIGTMLKQDFQRAMIARIPAIEGHPEKHWRAAIFLCDEYQSFATTGESDPTGDEKFFALSRQAKCIPIVATQSISSLRSTLPGESWRTLLQTFRTKIFLTLNDDFSARTASELCGKQEHLKLNYSISENGQDARVSMLTGKATAHRATISTSKSYNVQRDWVFEPKIFAELKNAQSIVLAYDGLNPLSPSYCYLKPYYLDPNTTYFEQLEKGQL
jgi:hypothetical protein